MAGYWKVIGVYRGTTNCSIPPETLELRFTTKPTITYYAPGGCGANRYNFSVNSTNLAAISNHSAWYHAIGSPVFVSDENEKHDCINGQCVELTVYGTTGKFATLAECQSNCGSPGCPAPLECLDPDNYCPPGKVCIPASEYANDLNLARQIKSKICG